MTDNEARPQHPERGVVAAAVQIDGMTVSMPAPARHYDVLRGLHFLGITIEKIGPGNQGFLDHRGVFLGRKAARITAAQFGQLNPKQVESDGDLFSEDLW